MQAYALGETRRLWQQRDIGEFRSVSLTKPMVVIGLIAVLAQGCASKAPNPLAGEDLTGLAKTCDASAISKTSENEAAASIAMSNDGWCAVRATEEPGKPYLLGLVRTRPDHGQILIQKTIGKTRIEYTPIKNYVGADSFSIGLRSQEPEKPDLVLQVSVIVSPTAEPVASTSKPSPDGLRS